MRFLQQSLALFLSWCLLLVGTQNSFAAQADPSGSQPPQAVQQSTEQLQQLVAPIALYPDALIAQIMAAATFPDQIADAGRWMAQPSRPHRRPAGPGSGQAILGSQCQSSCAVSR